MPELTNVTVNQVLDDVVWSYSLSGVNVILIFFVPV